MTVNFILFLILSISFTALADSKNKIEPISDKRKIEIKHIVLHDCGSCHGITLKGGLGPDIRAAAVKLKPQHYILETIRQGKPGTPMPPWKDIFTAQEIQYLTTSLVEGKFTE